MKIIFKVLMLTFIIIGLCSCNTTSSDNKATNSEKPTTENTKSSNENVITSQAKESTDTTSDQNDSSSEDNKNTSFKKTVKIYIIGEGSDYHFDTEDVEVTVTNGEIAKAIIEELINSKRNGIPEGTKLLSLNLKGDTLYINLSKEFKENINLGSGYEAMMVFSIVNSITELQNIKKVQFLIEGNTSEVLSHMTFDKPFTRELEPIGNE